jgi:hypothetical protein
MEEFDYWFVQEENQRPSGSVGKSAGIDNLPSVVLNGYNYRQAIL